MSLLLLTHERFVDHDAGPHHPERPDRLAAVIAGIDGLHLGSDLVTVAPTPVAPAALLAVHDSRLIASLEALDRSGGGSIDSDTAMNAASWEAAQLAAGAGLDAVAALDEGAADAAFCVVRPPGHHATPVRSMGFCLLNNVAVTARFLADRGERVLIVDYDAHHGNGTEAAFIDDGRVLFVSFHQSPLYPGTGRLEERGSGDGLGATLNLPMPAGTTGDHYRRLWDELAAPVVERFAPTWVLLSAGFDGHRCDPITGLGLTSADLADLTFDVASVVDPGRTIAFLEGGYDLDALALCAHDVAAALTGVRSHSESPTSSGPGAAEVATALEFHRRFA